MTDWHFQPVFRLMEAMTSGAVDAQTLLSHFEQRHKNHNGKVNAIVATDFENAHKRAIAADDARARGESWGPLHGLPITLKDAWEVPGIPCAGGTPEYASHRPDTHAVPAQRLVDAGAIVFGKTNVPYLSSDLQTYNAVYGTTNNPWDPGCGPGGSSGGAAAALAAGLTPAEYGSDIGGSIRTPAHLCGVFGHKPSFGLVPMRGHIPGPPGTIGDGDLAVAGPLGLSARDLELLLALTAGPDAWQAPAWRLQLPEARARSPKDLRVAVWLEDPFCDIDTQSAQCMENAARALEKAGARINHNARPDFTLAESTELYLTLLHSNLAVGMPESVKERWRALKPTLAPEDKSHTALQARGGTLSHEDWIRLDEKRQHMRARWADFFRDYDVVLAPVLMRPAFPHLQTPDWSQRRLQVNGQEREYFDVLLWAGPAIVSYLPASVAPVGRTKQGLPVGIQIIGPFLEDRTTLAVAGMIEELTGGFTPPPGY